MSRKLLLFLMLAVALPSQAQTFYYLWFSSECELALPSGDTSFLDLKARTLDIEAAQRGCPLEQAGLLAWWQSQQQRPGQGLELLAEVQAEVEAANSRLIASDALRSLYLTRAHLYLELDQLQAAQLHLDSALVYPARSPGTRLAVQHLQGRLRQAQGIFTAAQRHLTQAEQLRQQYFAEETTVKAEIALRRAQVALAQADTTAARRWLDSVRVGASLPPSLKAALYLEKGRLARDPALLDQAQAIIPKADTSLALAVAIAQQRLRYRRPTTRPAAIRNLMALAREHPASTAPYALRPAYEQMATHFGTEPAGLDWARQALTLTQRWRPGQGVEVDTYLLLARIYATLGQADSALLLLQKGHAVNAIGWQAQGVDDFPPPEAVVDWERWSALQAWQAQCLRAVAQPAAAETAAFALYRYLPYQSRVRPLSPTDRCLDWYRTTLAPFPAARFDTLRHRWQGVELGRELQRLREACGLRDTYRAAQPQLVARERRIQHQYLEVRQHLALAPARQTYWQRMRRRNQAALDSLQAVLATEHPGYLSLSQIHSPVPLPAVQAFLQAQQQGLLAWQLTTPDTPRYRLHTWLMTGDTLLQVSSEADSTLLNQMAAFAQLSRRQSLSDSLARLGQVLYQRLWQPLAQAYGKPLPPRMAVLSTEMGIDSPWELAVGEMGLTWELLLSQSVEPATSAEQWPFLLRDHAFSRVGSLGAWWQAHQREEFAGDSVLFMSTRPNATVDLATAWDQNRILTGLAAQQDSFRYFAPGMRLVHLDVPIGFDDFSSEGGQQAWLEFKAGSLSDSLDPRLYLLDVYRRPQPLEHLTLARYQSSTAATWVDGLRMHQACRAVGVQSVLAVQAGTVDSLAQRTMREFYAALRAGKPRDVALQQAQLAYLDRSGDNFRPGVWQAITLHGISTPLHDKGPYLWFLLILVPMILIWYFNREKKAPETPEETDQAA